jgi:hypothetical protein
VRKHFPIGRIIAWRVRGEKQKAAVEAKMRRNAPYCGQRKTLPNCSGSVLQT